MTLPIRPDATATNSTRSWLAKHTNTIRPYTPAPTLGERVLDALREIPTSGAQALWQLAHEAGRGGAQTASKVDDAVAAARAGLPMAALKHAGGALATAALTVGTPEADEADAAARDVADATAQRDGDSFAKVIGDSIKEATRSAAKEAFDRIGESDGEGGVAVAQLPKLAKRWATLTAENPGGKAASEGDNLVASLKLQDELQNMGFKPVPVNGRYTDDQTGQLLTEHSFYVPGMTREQAMALGKKYGQNSVITQDGLHDIGANITYPSRGVVAGSDALHTEFPNGSRFALDLDFEHPQPIPAGPNYPIGGAPFVQTPQRWTPTPRGVFERTPGSDTYREPAPLPFTPTMGPKSRIDPLAEQIANDPRVEARIREDVERGLPLGGESWYGLLPVRNSYEEMNGPISFADFNMAGAAGSARTATHNELTNASINLFAKAHAITPEEARQEFLARFPDSMRPTFMGTHGLLFDRGQANGAMVPANLTDGALKIPSYYHDRMLGANGVAIDTHEMRAMAQALGLPEDVVMHGVTANGPSYLTATQPYLRVAQDLGLHPDQVQASRWIGGGRATGLKSQPTGDFLQTLEDGLLYTAQQRGLDTSPKGLRNLWQAIAQGQDFFLPYSGAGGFPVK